jgi:Zn-dependent protease
MDSLLLLYLVLVVAPISNLIHEIGHTVGARLAKADRVIIRIGKGKQIIKFVYPKLEIYVGLLYFTAGVTESKRAKDYTSFEKLYITFFGPFFNALVVFICYGIYQFTANELILVFLLYNSWLFLMNSVPFKLRDQKSDGYIMLREILAKRIK